MPMFDKRDVVGKDIVSNRLDCFSIYSLIGGSIWSSRASDLYVSSEETRFYSGNWVEGSVQGSCQYSFV